VHARAARRSQRTDHRRHAAKVRELTADLNEEGLRVCGPIKQMPPTARPTAGPTSATTLVGYIGSWTRPQGIVGASLKALAEHGWR